MSHRTALLDYASGIAGDRSHGEDVVQEAWLRFDAISRRRPVEEPLSYLYRIVRNLAIDGRRRESRENLVMISGLDVIADIAPDEQPTPETVALFKDEYALVVEAMAELSERTRTALEMHRIAGAKLREIAASLGISLPLVHSLVAEGVAHCRRRLTQCS